MCATGKHILACVIILAIAHTISADYDANAYCPLFPDNTKLASADSCQDYYLCRAGTAIKQSCGAGLAFDKNARACKSASTVSCYFGDQNPCAKKGTGHVALPGTCNGWVYCVNSVEKGRGTCDKGMYFSNGNCEYGPCNSDGSNVNGFTSVCQIAPTNVYFASTVNCKTWQVCTNAGYNSGDCVNDFVFDIEGQICNYETDGMCKRSNGQVIQPDEPTPPEPCKAAEQDHKKGSATKCNEYFVCTNLKWIKHTCPAGYYFDDLTERCLARQTATPVKGCDRCIGANKPFVNGVDPTCATYQVCKNNVMTGSSKCEGGYFNEALGGCTNTKNGLDKYADDHGACYNPNSTTASPDTTTDDTTTEDTTTEDTTTPEE